MKLVQDKQGTEIPALPSPSFLMLCTLFPVPVGGVWNAEHVLD